MDDSVTADQLSEETKNKQKNPLGEMFERVFPYYLSIGMTAAEYWDGEPSLVRGFRRADEIRRQRTEETMWRLGLYFYHAICDASPAINALSKSSKPLPYMNEPFPTSEREAAERKKRDADAAYEEMRARFARDAAQSKKHDYSRKEEK